MKSTGYTIACHHPEGDEPKARNLLNLKRKVAFLEVELTDSGSTYNKAINQIVKSPSFREKVSSLGVIPTGGTPEELNVLIRDTNVAFSAMVEKSGFKIQ